jgi:hypothetical protein
MKKTFRIGVIVLFALFVVVAIVVVWSLDGIVKAGVEKFGPQITKVPVTLDSVHIDLLAGSAKIKSLVIGNPDGYKTSQAISVGLADVGVSPFSILQDKIVIRFVHIESPEITFEGGLAGNNLSKILDNANAFAKTSAASSTSASASGASQPGKKIEVDDFLITDAKVHVSITGFGGKEMTLPLPDIHLTDLGKGSDGLTPADLTRAILDAVTSATIKAVTARVDDLKVAGGLGKDATEGMDKIKKGLGSLFGK